jgi:hypothetical protein
MEEWLVGLLVAEQHADAKRVGRQILMLPDGAIAHAFIHQDSGYVRSAAALARDLAAGKRCETE